MCFCCTRVRARQNTLSLCKWLFYSNRTWCASSPGAYLHVLSTITLCIYILYVCGVLYCDVLYRFNKLRISACESWLMESIQIRAIRDSSKLHDNLVFSHAIHNIIVDPW